MPVAVLIPTFRRAHRVADITANVLDSTEHANVYFVCERDDKETISQVVRTFGANLIVNRCHRNYAGAINTGVLETDEPYVFAGADDLRFYEGWFETAVKLMRDGVEVVGSNDLGNPHVLAGIHATHYLVSRDYAMRGVADGQGIMLHEGYNHNWVDTEFVQTAKARGVFMPCLESVVEHLHYAWHKAEMDDTYRKGMAKESVDANLYREREHLWTTA